MPLKIAVDAMGGDYAPTEVIKGALVVAQERPELEIVLVGREAAISECLNALGDVPSTVTLKAADQAIEMGEHPVQATRRKRESSLVVSGLMVKSGEADATFSAGSTGAAMATATLDIGRIPGIERPALASAIPTIQGRALLLDAGANVDCSTRNLRQFALLGAIYAERVMGVPNPKLGLLNIGSEEGKGNDLAKEAHQLLKSTSLNFVGNVEGKDVFDHAVDRPGNQGVPRRFQSAFSASGPARSLLGVRRCDPARRQRRFRHRAWPFRRQSHCRRHPGGGGRGGRRLCPGYPRGAAGV